MNRKSFFDTMRLSAKELFLLWKGGLIFIVIFVAGVMGVISHSGVVFFEIILLSMFLGVLWFYPWMKKNPLIKGFLLLCLLGIFVNVITGDRLLTAITNFSVSGKNNLANSLNGKANSMRKAQLVVNTPLFSKGFRSMAYKKNTPARMEVAILGKDYKYQGIIYSKVLLPAKKNGRYLDGIFDSTSEKWWVPAEKLIAIQLKTKGSTACPNGFTVSNYSGPFQDDYYDVVLGKSLKGATVIFNARFTGINGKSLKRGTVEAKNIIPGTVKLQFSTLPAEGLCYKKI